MTVIDAQLHVFERNHAARPWTGAGSPVAEATGDSTVALMNAAGVDAAIIVSPWLNYLADPSYALEVAARHPGRFAVVAPVDPGQADQATFVKRWAQTPHAVGLRLMFWSPSDRERLADGGYDALLAAMNDATMPLCIALGPGTGEARTIAERFPGIPVVVDHLGLPSATTPPAPASPFERLPEVLALAGLPNVWLKITGAPALSHAGYPYLDLHAPLARMIDAFGANRLMWGTDRTRTSAFLGYPEGVSWVSRLKLSPGERELIMGATATGIFSLGR